MKKNPWGIHARWGLALLLSTGSATAAPLPVYSPTYPVPNAACATNGNFVSCSTKVLDYLASNSYPGFTGPYSFAASQGSLLDTIVVTANNGEILDNGDQVNPSENGFSTNNGGGKKYFSMGISLGWGRTPPVLAARPAGASLFRPGRRRPRRRCAGWWP